MKIKVQPMGTYQTNCYIVTIDNKDIIIDPGQGATKWVLSQCSNPIAILNTHGHFDHVWSNDDLKKRLNIPIYTPKLDCFMLENDPFGQGIPPSKPNYRVKEDATHTIEDIKVTFHHFPGHTPGCSMIEIKGCYFSGDFLFEGSIGRWDFPYSNGRDMVKSLEKVSKLKNDFPIYPGHGSPSNLKKELAYIPYWIKQVKQTI
ncbi:MAG TPA: MBL fold metallo-hydrolase [Epsilonproteobacteria bacterium]|nr:MBL fold metallo-hydrolase [Campylobacterota bacterium]